MVKIAIAGGSGSKLALPPWTALGACDLADTPTDVALEVIDALVATGKHEILLLSRKVRSSHLT